MYRAKEPRKPNLALMSIYLYFLHFVGLLCLLPKVINKSEQNDFRSIGMYLYDCLNI